MKAAQALALFEGLDFVAPEQIQEQIQQHQTELTKHGGLKADTAVLYCSSCNKIYWDGKDADGDNLANGVYFYKLIMKDDDKTEESIHKMAILK